LRTLIHDSPVGPLTLIADAGKLVGCYFANHPAALAATGLDAAPAAGATAGTDDDGTPDDDAVLECTRRELDAFFARQSRTFSVPVDPRGTPFQRRVWQALRAIPYGQTVSYGHIARAIGAPAAVRAVGAANGRNPICIIIPCHRVVGASGALTGFGGGLPRKRFLLDLEAPPRLGLAIVSGGPRQLSLAQGAG
jgi:methylated-DNA-[protein]-cysteine S-methyltransferase